MKRSSNNLLLNIKEPFAPATELSHVPVALYEIQFLATRGRVEEILPLIQSVIAVTQSRPDCLAELPQDQIVAIFEQAYAAPATQPDAA
jgi:hypothetical protein